MYHFTGPKRPYSVETYIILGEILELELERWSVAMKKQYEG